MKLASIEKIKSIIDHPNGEFLSIVTVLNYQVIVKRNQFKVEDLVVFISPDTVLPDAEWAKFYKAKSSRVRAIKLRGVFSMGIVESPSIIQYNTFLAEEGYEVSGILGITHYEPPLPQNLDAKGNLPHGIFKSDEERYQNLLNIPYGEIVDVTLKIDGSSLTAYCKKTLELETADWDYHYDTGITTRSMDLKLDAVNNYTIIAKKIDILNKLTHFCNKFKVNLALRGEIYGGGIQAGPVNPHAKLPLGFALFSVLNLDTLNYEGTEGLFYYEKVAEILNIETVPMLEKGVILTPELIKKYDEELTEINGQPFEGVVIKLKNGGSFKVINKHYDSKK
jgi:RNA ligase (TIGR02306 family)